MKGVFIILDGAADEKSGKLDNKTPLEAAKTPNLDEIAKKSEINYCYTVKEGFAPPSDIAILSLLGYNSLVSSRGTLEALGLGLKLTRGDIAFRTNFATIDNLEKRKILDRRAGRSITLKEARILAWAINKKVKLPFKFEFYPSIHHRGVLVIRGGFSDNISSVDANAKTGKLEFSKPLDDEDDSQMASELVNNFVRQSFDVLNSHYINIKRKKSRMKQANIILCRGASSSINLKKIRGNWLALGYTPLGIGIAQAAGMNVYKFKYPKLRSYDVYSNLFKGLKKAIKRAKRMLKWKRDKYDYFFIHLKEIDVAGHDGKTDEKVKMIELLDKRFFSFLKKFIGSKKLIITCDHATSSSKKAHTSSPVPVLSYPARSRNQREKRFTEKYALQGKKLAGNKLADKYLFN